MVNLPGNSQTLCTWGDFKCESNSKRNQTKQCTEILDMIILMRTTSV